MLVNWTDILDGEIVNAAWAVAQMMAKPRTSRHVEANLNMVAWADIGQLTKEALPRIKAARQMPNLSEEEVAELEAALEWHEVQGALQALLAVRLTGAPEADAARARESVRLALTTGPTSLPDYAPLSPDRLTTRKLMQGPRRDSPRSSSTPHVNWSAATTTSAANESVSGRYASQLSEYFDDKISALVTELKERVGFAGLAQARAEAYGTRIVGLLGTIADMLAALSHPERGGPEEADFLSRYRRQVQERHGKIEPPDFERRRRIPVEQIYVNASVYAYDDQRGEFRSTPVRQPSLNVMNLTGLLNRTVLLGDPGGGKTTAANVLANYFASHVTCKVPFLVTLRSFAAKEPIEHSIAEYIKQMVKTLYQCDVPDGLVERLLVTGRAIVIFDGLDELLDTSRRRDVSDRVEQFCSAYPLTPVLVTSRIVGYDQARLDDTQFTCYRLGGFRNNEVTEYVSRWFAVQDGFTPVEAANEAYAFLMESACAPDLRYNPLLLSLMCILYRGEGSLPHDRPGIYGRCAELLLGKWDERRKIHHKLQAGHLVEPAIRHLAWWLFNSNDSQATVSERFLLHETTGFFYGRGPESEEGAWATAKEFVEFCCGRMWVFSDAGTTEYGEKLYAFTHRTFLEYFAAAHLATVSDTPEDLAHAIASHVGALKGWNLVCELAMQIKDRNSDRGTDRIYEILLNPAVAPGEHGSLLTFLIESLSSTRPSPSTLRKLTRASLNYRMPRNSPATGDHPLLLLVNRSAGYEQIIADELSNQIAITRSDTVMRTTWLEIALEISEYNVNAFWSQWSREQAARYAAQIAAEAERSISLRRLALNAHVISMGQALAMPGGLSALMQSYPKLLSMNSSIPYPVSIIFSRPDGRDLTRELAEIGRYLIRHPKLPWASGIRHYNTAPDLGSHVKALQLDELSGLGFAAVSAMSSEIFKFSGPVDFYHIPMPIQFRPLFQDWIEGKVTITTIV